MPSFYTDLSVDEMEYDGEGFFSNLFKGIGAAATAIAGIVLGVAVGAAATAAGGLVLAVLGAACVTPVGLLAIGLIVGGCVLVACL